ncbi:hypothetical protein DPEC_G00248080 [Dallia pectoralis]|uniref:Uncharacterized protein n=1 Tax=Dallia pectoralis TaxID=75939 RepID=A0ACC2FX03_DALPE|nr:hypothetical protein DPEC_G00248080 [Dallia pectoralis]
MLPHSGLQWTERGKNSLAIYNSSGCYPTGCFFPEASSGPGSPVFFPLQLDSSLFALVPGSLVHCLI